MLSQYVETALWCSTDDSERPMDESYSINSLSPEATAAMRADCDRFQAMADRLGLLGDVDLGRVAHDFWLTRNHHGAGFWDGDYPDPERELLTDLAHCFGECDLYVGDDGLLYLS